METIINHLEEELRNSNSNIETLLEEYSKLEDINRDLISLKANIIGDTVNLKAKTTFLKKEIEIRKAHLDTIMKSQNQTILDKRAQKQSKLETSLKTINDLISQINSRKNIGLENISEEILYIIN